MNSLALVLLVALFFAGCAAGPNPAVNTASPGGGVAGFWLGWWHGIIVVVTFIISLFDSSVHFYEVHNNGGWYNIGFLLGAGAFLGGASSAVSSRRK
jgi:hypothetical protein